MPALCTCGIVPPSRPTRHAIDQPSLPGLTPGACIAQSLRPEFANRAWAQSLRTERAAIVCAQGCAPALRASCASSARELWAQALGARSGHQSDYWARALALRASLGSVRERCVQALCARSGRNLWARQALQALTLCASSVVQASPLCTRFVRELCAQALGASSARKRRAQALALGSSFVRQLCALLCVRKLCLCALWASLAH